MNLSVEQIVYIQERVDQSKIDIRTLRDDVLDHLCCAVESGLEEGKTFDEALTEAMHELAPKGLDDLQRKTVFLLNATKIIAMKKMIYGIGLASTIGMSLGLMFKFMRWRGADELISYGFLGFALLFVPMVFADHFKMKLQASLPEKLRIFSGIASAVAMAMSIIFKIVDWTGADVLLLAGALLFSFGFLPFQFFALYKRSLHH